MPYSETGTLSEQKACHCYEAGWLVSCQNGPISIPRARHFTWVLGFNSDPHVHRALTPNHEAITPVPGINDFHNVEIRRE